VALPPQAPPGVAPELVGRDPELQAVRDALTAMPGVAGVVLEGDAGIGKSALWEAGLLYAEQHGLRLASARPAEAESTLSHAALGDLLAPLADEFGGELPDPQRHALDVAFLRSSAGAVDRRAVGAATLGLLRMAAKRTPLLVAIDDIQWLDPASAGAVRSAFRRLGDEPVALLATRRVGRPAEPLDMGLASDRLRRILLGRSRPMRCSAYCRTDSRVYAKLGIRSRTELAAIRQASDGRSRSPAPPRASRS
jgi:AAA ATPase domain